jgi:hypothetical protein
MTDQAQPPGKKKWVAGEVRDHANKHFVHEKGLAACPFCGGPPDDAQHPPIECIARFACVSRCLKAPG